MKCDWYYLNNFYSPEYCKQISDMFKNSTSNSFDRPADNVIKTAKVSGLDWATCKTALWALEDAAVHINQRNFGFNLYPLTAHDFINHNTYQSVDNGQYDWHKDASMNEIYDLKLTVIANISTEPYEGGKFELFLNKPVHIKELDIPGTVLIFPSFTMHRVTPVTRGVRETVSIWLHGPNFR
jgi:PKHD-type hydroxylase